MHNKNAIRFGTDGIRGQSNSPPMTADCALRVGMAAGRYFRRNTTNEHRVVIGKDTRRSGYMLENALTAGLTAMGMNVLLLGPVPTPAVGLLTRSMRADLGVMITASHNQFADNGIKFFGPDGHKLADSAEKEIEDLLRNGSFELVSSQHIGRAKRIDHGLGRYVEFVKTTFPKHLRLNGLRVVVDCANGAGYRAAPDVLWELGAEVVPIGVDPNGFNINAECGSMHPDRAARKVLETRADVGICLDGDADRLVVVDNCGKVVNGDQILAFLAQRWSAAKRLKKNTLVSTVMSNLSMETYLQSQGIKMQRTRVGDRHVISAMRAGGFNLGGEQSGHIVMTDYTTTGDGLVSSLQFLAALVESEKPASEIAHVFEPIPQTQINVPIRSDANPLESERYKQAMTKAQQCINGKGRLFVRQSGTEPVVRILLEGHEDPELTELVDGIIEAISRCA